MFLLSCYFLAPNYNVELGIVVMGCVVDVRYRVIKGVSFERA